MRLFAAAALVVASAMTGSTACSGGAESSSAQLVQGTDWTYTNVYVYKDPADGTFSGGLFATNLTGDRIPAIVTVIASAGPSTDCPGPRLGVLTASVTLTPGEAPCLDVHLTAD
jgi:hypothetical protein